MRQRVLAVNSEDKVPHLHPLIPRFASGLDAVDNNGRPNPRHSYP